MSENEEKWDFMGKILAEHAHDAINHGLADFKRECFRMEKENTTLKATIKEQADRVAKAIEKIDHTLGHINDTYKDSDLTDYATVKFLLSTAKKLLNEGK